MRNVSRRITETAWGYELQGERPWRDEVVVYCHGNALGANKKDTFDSSLRKIRFTDNVVVGGLFDQLLNAGYTVRFPWIGSTWGGNIDPHGVGALGLPAINSAIGAETDVHLIGASMGGFIAPLWGSKNLAKVKSMLLISPAINILSIFNLMYKNPILGVVAEEMLDARGITSDPANSDFEAALLNEEADLSSLSTKLTPIKSKIKLITCSNDVVIPIAGINEFISEVGGLDSVIFDSGSSENRHPAPYNPELGWDNVEPLRLISKFA